MRKIRFIGAGVAAAAVLTLIQPSAADASMALTAKESLRIRSKATTHSAALGVLPKGAKMSAQTERSGGRDVIRFYMGGKHNACIKHTIHDATWVKVTYRRTTGFVPWPCVY